MKCQVEGCKDPGHWQRIETLEKPSIGYSFSIKTNLCALHSTHLNFSFEKGTKFSDEIIHEDNF
jgi:hypothetical protein